MKKFNVIVYNCNSKKFVEYDIMPYLRDVYFRKKERGDKLPQTFEEIKEFIKTECQYHFWARCEYEIVLVDWPNQQRSEKWDVYKQIMMNLDIITETFIYNIAF